MTPSNEQIERAKETLVRLTEDLVFEPERNEIITALSVLSDYQSIKAEFSSLPEDKINNPKKDTWAWHWKVRWKIAMRERDRVKADRDRMREALQKISDYGDSYNIFSIAKQALEGGEK